MQMYSYGAHEVLELHEVLNTAIDSCNTLQLFVPYVQDPELRQILSAQLQFAQSEYNNMVHLVQGIGIGAAVPYRARIPQAVMSTAQPAMTAQPNAFPGQMDDRDVASAMLGMHKSAAKLKMQASLEAANPQIRNMLLQSAVNCANQAYEVWGYMQRRGFYPLASLQETAQAQLLRGYQPVAAEQSPMMHMQGAPVAQADGGMAVGAVPTEPTPAVPKQPSSYAAGEPLQAAPKSSVNASQIFSSPTYRQEHFPAGDDQTAMVHEGLSPQMGDPLAALTHQTDLRPARGSRKKGIDTDSTITG